MRLTLLLCIVLSSPLNTFAQPSDTPQAALNDWIIPTSRTYQATEEHLTDGTTSTLEVTEVWTTESPDFYRVTTTERQADKPDTVSSARFRLDARGWGYSENVLSSGARLTFDPPKYVLLLPARVEESWSKAESAKDQEQLSIRTCQQRLASPFCADGVVVTCRTTRSKQDIVIREHYCPQQGWRGTEAAVYVDDHLTLSYRTTRVQVHAVTFSDPPDSARPNPTPAHVPHPTP
jgi:hypothetical protein